MFARINKPEQVALNPLAILYSAGSYGLFLGQGCLVVLENVIGPALIQTRSYKRCKTSSTLSTILSVLQSVYVYGSLIWMARWFVANLVSFDMFTREQIQSLTLKSLWNDAKASEWYQSSISHRYFY